MGSQETRINLIWKQDILEQKNKKKEKNLEEQLHTIIIIHMTRQIFWWLKKWTDMDICRLRYGNSEYDFRIRYSVCMVYWSIHKYRDANPFGPFCRSKKSSSRIWSSMQFVMHICAAGPKGNNWLILADAHALGSVYKRNWLYRRQNTWTVSLYISRTSCMVYRRKWHSGWNLQLAHPNQGRWEESSNAVYGQKWSLAIQHSKLTLRIVILGICC